MRFAYIDSNGNEVPIPSVDALALRIELGAIKEDTELYDAQADQWGPAHTHEIFHTLARAAVGGDGFVAPPPPVAPPPAASGQDAPKASEKKKPAEKKAEKKKTKKEAPVPRAEGARPAEPPADEPEGPGFRLDLAPPPEEPPAAGPESSDPPPGGGFDFGDITGGFELERSDSAPMDFGAGAFVSEEDGPMMEFGGGLDLEEPMSEFKPDSPPGWMEAGHEVDEGDVMDFSSIVTEPAAAEEASEAKGRAQRAARTKPSPPKFRRRRNLVAPMLGIVVLLSLGVGGYVAWPIVSARLADDGPTAQPGVFLPPIPEELVPQMREAAGVAFAGAFAEARATARGGLQSPPREWLAGVYLANASRYPGVETFWQQMGDVLEHLRAIDLASFHGHYARALASAGVAADVRDALAARADSGFVAASAARAETWRLADDVVTASLELHQFLVANEENIEHVPATSMTSDPVLEARAAVPAVAEALEEHIDRVTDALDALDYLNLVTADGFWSTVLSRIQDVGVR